MHRVSRISIGAFILACLLFGAHSVKAATLTSVLIRPDRTKVGIAPGPILVEIRPTTVATEGKLVFELDSRLSAGTHFSTLASDYTTTTASIPSGFSPLPLTSATATSVSGHTVTFAVSDLDVNTTYVFYITGGYLLNRSAAEYLTVVSTQTAASSTIDSQNVWTETKANDQIVINATVRPASSNLTATLTPEQFNTLNRQDSELGFTITYGTDAAVSGPLTLQASWNLGTPEGQTAASQAILEYTVGSATNAYGSTPPVIDTVNRTITWSIASYPANIANQTVHFALHTTSDYTGDKKVVVPIYAQITAPVQSSVDTQTITYLYVQPTATATSTPTPTPSTTAQSSASVPRFVSIATTGIFDTSSTFTVELDTPAHLTIRYGKSPRTLNQKFSTTNSAATHLIKLPDLEPDTYYFVIFDLYSDSKLITSSDLYTFHTAKIDTNAPKPIKESFVLLQDKSPIYGADNDAIGQRLSVVSNQVIDLQLAITHGDHVKKAVASLRQSQILGLTDQNTAEPDLSQTSLVEIAPDRFVGKMRTPNRPGTYFLMVRTESKTGAIEETPIASIRLVSALKIVDAAGSPIENAKAIVERYNPQTRIYESLSQASTSIRSHVQSDNTGTISFNLSAGTYRISIDAIGFAKKQLDVEIGFSHATPYPVVALDALPFSVALFTSYYSNTADNIRATVESLLEQLTTSPRFWDLFMVLTLIGITFFTIASFSLRLGIPFFKLIPAMLSHFKYLNERKSTHIFHGTITDATTHDPVRQARVRIHLQDHDHTERFALTNDLGEFALIVPVKTDKLCYTLERSGYTSMTTCIPADTSVPHRLLLERDLSTHRFGVREVLSSFVYVLIDFGLEFLFVAALLCEIYLLLQGEIALFATFFFMTSVCIAVWAYWKHLWNFRMSHLQSW